MTNPTPVTDEIFPQNSGKTYTLVELMRGESPMVGKGPEDTVFSFPIVLLWEIVLTLGVGLAILLFSLVKQAPLEEIANPLITTDPAKAPWYFVGLQELRSLFCSWLRCHILITLASALACGFHRRAVNGSLDGQRCIHWSSCQPTYCWTTVLAYANYCAMPCRNGWRKGYCRQRSSLCLWHYRRWSCGD
ncbi:MAG: hypothetical protein HZB17_08890 [Chloroflexi bacterium]|nr:hypothetical protein [Chloroflexota bacterium]